MLVKHTFQDTQNASEKSICKKRKISYLRNIRAMKQGEVDMKSNEFEFNGYKASVTQDEYVL